VGKNTNTATLVGKNTILLALVGKNTKYRGMVGDNTNPETANPLDYLLPERHPQHDLFICDVADAVLKDVMQQMEHPFYSLSKKPEIGIRRYEYNGNTLEITPSVKGLATIYDKDILIYCISQVMAALKAGKQVSQRVRINSHELLMFTNRGTSGREYLALKEALDRLAGTRISTNIRTGDEEVYDNFGLIDTFGMRRKHGDDGRLIWCDVKLSDWVFNAIRHNEVLTLHRDYFRLRKPIERRVYELARKHCGHQPQLEMRVDTLHQKSGSKSDLKEFRRAVRELAQGNHLPDYRVEFDEVTDRVRFINRDGLGSRQEVEPWRGSLSPDILTEARKYAPGWDIHHVESQWRNWLGEKKINPRTPERNFIKFCQSWFAKRGRP